MIYMVEIAVGLECFSTTVLQLIRDFPTGFPQPLHRSLSHGFLSKSANSPPVMHMISVRIISRRCAHHFISFFVPFPAKKRAKGKRNR